MIKIYHETMVGFATSYVESSWTHGIPFDGKDQMG
jgi:hypothetical protein